MNAIKTTMLLGMVLAVAGCKVASGPLPAGAPDVVDATANEILQPAHAFAAVITEAVISTDPSVHIELTDAQKSVLITLNTSLNVADSLEIAYHSVPVAANAAALKTATATVAKNLAVAQSVINVVVLK